MTGRILKQNSITWRNTTPPYPAPPTIQSRLVADPPLEQYVVSRTISHDFRVLCHDMH